MNEVTLKLTVQQAEALKRLVGIQSVQSMTNTLTGVAGDAAVRLMTPEQAENEAGELFMKLYTMKGIINRAIAGATSTVGELDPMPDFAGKAAANAAALKNAVDAGHAIKICPRCGSKVAKNVRDDL